MRVNINELLNEIAKADAYVMPARIVARYKTLTGSAYSPEMPSGVTMHQMLQAVVAADGAHLRADSFGDSLSSLATR